MASSTGGRLTVDNHSIFYTITSSTSLATGPAILLLHGWTCDSTDWSSQIPYLTTTFPSVRIIALDLRHHGGSRPLNPHTTPQTPESIAHDTAISTLVSDCAALLIHLNIGVSPKGPTSPNDRAIVIGHSLGGLIAADLAHQHPTLVRGTVLVDASYLVPHQAFAAFVGQLKQSYEAAVDGFFNSLYVPSTPESVKTWNRIRAWGKDRDVTIQGMQATVDGLLEGCGGESGGPADYIRNRCRVEGVKRLTVCSGDKPYLDHEREVGLRGDGVDQMEVLERGHWMAKSAPEEFNAIVEKWLRESMGFVKA